MDGIRRDGGDVGGHAVARRGAAAGARGGEGGGDERPGPTRRGQRGCREG